MCERDNIKDLHDILQSKKMSSLLPTYFERFDNTQLQILCEAFNLHTLKKETKEKQVLGLARLVTFTMKARGSWLARWIDKKTYNNRHEIPPLLKQTIESFKGGHTNPRDT